MALFRKQLTKPQSLLAIVFGSDSNFAKQPLAFAVALLGVLIWAGWYVMSRWGVSGNMTPADVALTRYATAAVCALPFLYLCRGRKIAWKVLAILIPTYGVLYTMPLFYGLQTTPVAKAGVLFNGMLPVFNAVLAVMVFKQGISKVKWLAIGIVFVANACMFYAAGLADVELALGWGLILFAVLMLAIYMSVLRQHPVEWQVAIPAVALGNFVLFIPLWFFLDSNLPAVPLPEIASQAFYQGFINQILVIGMYAYMVPRLGSVSTSIVFGFVPATTALMGWLFLGEGLVVLEVVGIIGCTIGILLFSRSRS